MTVRISNTPPQKWNEWLDQLAEDKFTLHHYQVWAERLKIIRGYDPVYFMVLDGDTVVGLLLATEIRPLKLKSPREIAYYTLKCLKTISLGQLTWYTEPATIENNHNQILAKLAESINQYADTNRLKVINAHWSTHCLEELPDNWSYRKWATLTVDCTQDDETLLASFKPAARKSIRKAINDGITVRRIENIDQMREYYGFARQCSKRYGKKLSGVADFENLFNEIREKAIFQTFVAEKDEEPISGLSVWGNGRCIQELGSFNSEKAYREKLYGADLLKWEIIRWARENGIRSFDLAGINPQPADTKEQNIRRFKEKWGGSYSEYLLVDSH